MSAVTAKGRRLRTAAVVTAWVAVLLAISFWSVRKDPPTVAEQRDIAEAMPELSRATGSLFAAAAGDDRWVLRLGELRIEDCSITPVRPGRVASRDLTVFVPEGEARTALDAIAAGLPDGYQPSVMAMRGGTRLSLYADAGAFIAIEAEALSVDQQLTIRAGSGCRPASRTAETTDPVAGPAPASLAAVLSALNADATEPETRAVACPDGGTAATFVADGGPADPEDGPRGVPDGTVPVWADAGGWAYRMGSDSVVVTAQGGRLQVSVTTACRAG
ncbi:hypothetical protein FB565_005575 [Actinoplanes lutulentus]|uniref:Uncharacterized protein n=1 Tax=Actinoplanes lutulentus TaxID=1287878 RepID=A0A327ZBR4_9ACTN|nr:hypothetical protein [Actinoplanes lutulentus]MBB2945817.1 hypothetical protein [Actinoplanes lutulentus]RAK37866.1 hypothetical protein B0I29_106135 [Actinoplanes lutulentus]